MPIFAQVNHGPQVTELRPPVWLGTPCHFLPRVSILSAATQPVSPRQTRCNFSPRHARRYQLHPGWLVANSRSGEGRRVTAGPPSHPLDNTLQFTPIYRLPCCRFAERLQCAPSAENLRLTNCKFNYGYLCVPGRSFRPFRSPWWSKATTSAWTLLARIVEALVKALAWTLRRRSRMAAGDWR